MKLKLPGAIRIVAIFLFTLLFAVFVLAPTRATAASVGPGGYSNSFNTIQAAADWATFSIAGGNADAYNPDAEVNASISASIVTAPALADGGNPPVANASATWSSSGLYLQ